MHNVRPFKMNCLHLPKKKKKMGLGEKGGNLFFLKKKKKNIFFLKN